MLGDPETGLTGDPLIDLHLKIKQWKKMEEELVIYRIFAQEIKEAREWGSSGMYNRAALALSKLTEALNPNAKSDSFCNHHLIDAHRCPYKEEINQDYSLCNCCKACQDECSQSI